MCYVHVLMAALPTVSYVRYTAYLRYVRHIYMKSHIRLGNNLMYVCITRVKPEGDKAPEATRAQKGAKQEGTALGQNKVQAPIKGPPNYPSWSELSITVFTVTVTAAAAVAAAATITSAVFSIPVGRRRSSLPSSLLMSCCCRPQRLQASPAKPGCSRSAQIPCQLSKVLWHKQLQHRLVHITIRCSCCRCCLHNAPIPGSDATIGCAFQHNMCRVLDAAWAAWALRTGGCTASGL